VAVKLIAVSSDNIETAWDDVKKYIGDGLDYADGKFKPEDIKRSLLERDMQLWVAYNVEKQSAVGCGVTQILVYPQEKRIMFFLAAGDTSSDLLGLLEPIYDWGRQQGCSAVELYGRKGWTKLLKDYEQIHVVLRKRL